MTEAQKRAQHEYDRRMAVRYCLKLNKGTDADIIARLQWAADTGITKQGYIKSLIRADMKGA